MVKNEFERITLERITQIGDIVMKLDVTSSNIKEDLTEIKCNVKELCTRTTTLEVERENKIKNQNDKIKVMAVAFSGISALGVIIALMPYMNHIH
jgi:sporulation protein YlmC with PRC-barrel domain